MAFELSPAVEVDRDDQGNVRLLRHPQEPYTPDRAGLTAPSPGELADQYVAEVAPLYGIEEEQVADLTRSAAAEPVVEGPRLRRSEEKTVMDTTVVSYEQTAVGLPVWQAALEVRVHGDPPRVTSSDSTLHLDLEIEPPPTDALQAFTGDNPVELAQVLGLDPEAGQQIVINSTRLLVYQYDPAQRLDPMITAPGAGEPLQAGPPTLPLPPVPDTIQPGRHYVVREVLFAYPLPDWGHVDWQAFIEPQTRAVLYLRALVAAQTACVFVTDPVTSTGNALTGCSPAADLDAARMTVPLLGLDPPDGAGQQALRGNFVALTDTDLPTVAAPTTATPFAFCYSAPTNDFAAANAYYHYDRLYRLVEGMGFQIAGPGGYFDGTQFPVPVDHAGVGNQMNAFAHGNATNTGMGRYRNGLASPGCPVGIAAVWRVVLHEFGHALLWDHVGSANFGWCHSAGDTLAIILNDPGSRAPDRFDTFPFTGIRRRHDRDVAAGWAWGGTNDDTQYLSEQILSTLLFRVYRVTGGDDPDIAVRRFAARYLAYLIIRAIGTLTVTTTDPRVFATAMMDADDQTVVFEGHPGGAWHKVIRWSFEQQGLWQPPGAPTPVQQPGAPPPVDVYIDDGRGGGYFPYLTDFTGTPEIWNRRAADGGTENEIPMLGQQSQIYVRVRNRGTQAANAVRVRVYQGDPAGGLVWPNGWQPVATPELPAAGPIAPSGETIVGPFAWIPRVPGEVVLASTSATGDISNAETVNGLIPHWRLVPLDNNLVARALDEGGHVASWISLLTTEEPVDQSWRVLFL
jgi:zinc metalloprotease ZmpB